MDPGALVPDVGHLQEVLIEAAAPEGLLEEGLMGPGRTSGDNDPVQFLFLNHFLQLLLGVLGAGE
jgi:hypothetical protein